MSRLPGPAGGQEGGLRPLLAVLPLAALRLGELEAQAPEELLQVRGPPALVPQPRIGDLHRLRHANAAPLIAGE
jgi:hypothetical protein